MSFSMIILLKMKVGDSIVIQVPDRMPNTVAQIYPQNQVPDQGQNHNPWPKLKAERSANKVKKLSLKFSKEKRTTIAK